MRVGAAERRRVEAGERGRTAQAEGGHGDEWGYFNDAVTNLPCSTSFAAETRGLSAAQAEMPQPGGPSSSPFRNAARPAPQQS